jgi:beta-phosphoglucomutase
MKLAIFDLDGVLAKTTDIHTAALRAAVGSIVSKEASQGSYLDAADGIRTKDKLKRLADDYGLSDETVDRIDTLKKKYTVDALSSVNTNQVLVDGFNSLKSRGYTIAVASNSRRDFVNLILRGIGVMSLIDFSISGDEVKNPKPDPEIFNTVILSFGAEPSATYIFEDSPNGIKAASQTGATVITVDPHTLVTESQFTLCK